MTREALVAAIVEELERQGDGEVITLHIKGDVPAIVRSVVELDQLADAILAAWGKEKA